MTAVLEYDARTDSRRRITLPNTGYEHYHLVQYDDGRILLEPRELVAPASISSRTLRMMDRAVERMAAGEVEGPVDPADLLASRG
jgi:hypothetical protein